MMKTIWIMAILAVVAFSGCTEKQAVENLTTTANSEAIETSRENGVAMQTVNGSLFLEDFNRINDPYKNTLFATGQGQRNESINHYENLTAALIAFEERYKDYRPPEIESDKQFSGDMMNASTIISSVKDDIYSGNLSKAHTKLEEVRPIFQKILIRNDLLPLSVTLVDFHDTMELILVAANNKDASKVLEVYPKADEKLRAVEAISSEPGIKAIRAKLIEIMILAKENKTEELPTKAEELKASYVKVYLATN